MFFLMTSGSHKEAPATELSELTKLFISHATSRCFDFLDELAVSLLLKDGTRIHGIIK